MGIKKKCIQFSEKNKKQSIIFGIGSRQKGKNVKWSFTSPAASIAANHSSEKGTASTTKDLLSCLLMLFDFFLKTTNQ